MTIKPRHLAWFFFACAVAGLLILWQLSGFGLGHWLQVHTGTVNESGPYYGFWSGFGSDLTEFGIFGLVGTWVIGWWHKHNCHTERCWRIGLHPLAGGTYVVCRKHHAEVTGHPHRKLSVEFLRSKHFEHLERISCTHPDHRAAT